MINEKTGLYLLLTISLIILGYGLVSLKINIFTEQLRIISYIMVGICCGGFGYNLSTIIKNRLLDKNPEMAGKIRIEENDERNTTIIKSAKSRAFDAMIYIYGSVILILGLLNTDLTIILLLVR